MVATKRPADVLVYPTGAEDSVVYRFAFPVTPSLPSAPRLRSAAPVAAPTEPERFDWFTLMLYVALAVGIAFIAALSYVVFVPPTPITP